MLSSQVQLRPFATTSSFYAAPSCYSPPPSSLQLSSSFDHQPISQPPSPSPSSLHPSVSPHTSGPSASYSSRRSPPSSRRYEEYAHILDINIGGKSSVIRGRSGTIITAIGENHLTLLEILGASNTIFDMCERIYIGKEGRIKILSVLGKTRYDKISESAKMNLPQAVENIVIVTESKFIKYINNAGPLSRRVHALELIPRIGKTYMKIILEEREKKMFESYADLCERVGLTDPITQIAERVVDEITGKSRMNVFVKR